jgi:DNA-binding NarL/FixJ family response regulator
MDRRWFVSRATVKTDVGRVFATVGARDRAQAVVRAHEHGLVESPDLNPQPS